MPTREKKLLGIKQGIVVLLIFAIVCTLTYTGITCWKVLQENKATAVQSSVTVNKGLFNVTISFPSASIANVFAEETAEEYVAGLQQQDGVKKAEVNQAGTVVLTVTRSYYKTLAESTRTRFTDNLTAYVNSGDYPFISQLAYSQDMATITVTVNLTAYNRLNDGTLAPKIGAQALFYLGLAESTAAQVQVVFVDGSTQETIETMTYTA